MFAEGVFQLDKDTVTRPPAVFALIVCQGFVNNLLHYAHVGPKERRVCPVYSTNPDQGLIVIPSWETPKKFM